MSRANLHARAFLSGFVALAALVVTAPITAGTAFAQPAAVFSGPLIELVRPTGLVGDGVSTADMYVLALAADGAPITGLKGKPSASAGSATDLVDVGGGLYRFAYTPARNDGSQQVTITLKTKLATKEAIERKWTIGVSAPKSRTLTGATNPSSVTLAQDASASVSFNLAGGDRQSLAGVDLAVRASAGAVQNVTHLGGGQFSALYTPPTVPYPHLALLTAVDRRDPDNAYIGMAVPLVGKVDFPVAAEPNARVLLNIGGRDFGPIQADAGGRARIPIIVPPGTASATLTQILPDGTKKVEPLPLGIPETRRVALFPTSAGIPSDARLKVPVRAFVATPEGRPDTTAQVTFTATAGTISQPLHEGGGVYVAMYTPPAGYTLGQADISVSLLEKPALQTDKLTVNLVPARASKVTITAEPPTLPTGATGFKVYAKVAGPDGTGLGNRAMKFAAGGARIQGETKDLRNGDYQATFTTTGSGPVELLASMPTPASGNPIAGVLLLASRDRVAADGLQTIPMTVVTVDQFGYPVANQPVTLKVASGDGTVPATVTTGADGTAQVFYTAGRSNGFVSIDATSGDFVASAALVQAPATIAVPDLTASAPKALAPIWAEWAAGIPILRIERDGAAGMAVSGTVETATSAGARAAKMSLVSEPASAAAGGTVRLRAQVLDANGRGVGGQKLDFLVSAGTVGAAQDMGDGTYVATYTVPAGTTGDVRISVATSDGAVSAFIKLPVGGADGAWGANPFAASTTTPATPFGGAPANAAPASTTPATTVPAATATPAATGAPATTPAPATIAPATNTTVTTATTPPSGRPWMRAHAGFVLANYDYDQQPLTTATVLFPTTIQLQAGAVGFHAGARAWIPSFRYVGADISVGMNRYTLDATPLCAELDRTCDGETVVADAVMDVRALIAGRYPFAVGGNEFWIGGKVGYGRSDIQAFKVVDDTIDLEQLTVNSLAVGPEVGAEIGTNMFFETSFLQHLAGGTVPYDTEFALTFGYAFLPNVYAALGYDLSARSVEVNNANLSPVGEIADTTHGGRLSIGTQF